MRVCVCGSVLMCVHLNTQRPEGDIRGSSSLFPWDRLCLNMDLGWQLANSANRNCLPYPQQWGHRLCSTIPTFVVGLFGLVFFLLTLVFYLFLNVSYISTMHIDLIYISLPPVPHSAPTSSHFQFHILFLLLMNPWVPLMVHICTWVWVIHPGMANLSVTRSPKESEWYFPPHQPSTVNHTPMKGRVQRLFSIPC